jgi:hypothetical protein
MSNNNSSDCMLTTIDNPYNPFKDFNLWLLFDKEQGYNTCEYIARLVNISDDMTQKEIDEETLRAIDTIITNDIFAIYKKVYETDTIEPEKV